MKEMKYLEATEFDNIKDIKVFMEKPYFYDKSY